MHSVLLPLALAAWPAATGAPAAVPLQVPVHVDRERDERRKAMGIAAVEVGGEVVAARPIDLNGATGGWEELVHMRDQCHGWRVVIDRDNWRLRSKSRVPNP